MQQLNVLCNENGTFVRYLKPSFVTLTTSALNILRINRFQFDIFEASSILVPQESVKLCVMCKCDNKTRFQHLSAQIHTCTVATGIYTW